MESKKLIYQENACGTAIYAIDEPNENNNAHHKFIISKVEKDGTEKELHEITLQNGNFAQNGYNGIFTEHLIAIAIDTLQRFNTSKYSCRENAIAITKLEEALMWIKSRTQKRVDRGVYGTDIV